jgi:hypothetical protein
MTSTDRTDAQKKAKRPRRQLHPPAPDPIAQPPAWYAVFLEAYRQSGNKLYACQVAGVHRSTLYDHVEKNPDFAKQIELAREDAIELLELEARNRALKKSDLLLIFLLKSLRPDVYREQVAVEHRGQVGGAVRFIDVEVVRPAPPDESKPDT